MKYALMLLVGSLITLSGCVNNEPPNYSFRDSAVAKYLEYADSAGPVDTTEMSYKMLKAYVNNDTAFLYKTLLKQKRLTRIVVKAFDHLPKLQDMDIDEGYRFFYSASFCPYGLNVTVSKKDTNISLHFIIYEGLSKISIINEFDKKLTLKNWEEFIEVMDKADFWGLKAENGIRGLDGDDMDVIGYTHRQLMPGESSRFNEVYRWGETTHNLFEPFRLLLMFSENTQGCIVIKKK